MSRLIDPITNLLAQLLRMLFEVTGSYGLAIILLALAFNLVGDGLRDAMDVRDAPES